MLNKRIQCTPKSKHFGQTGVVVADYGSMLVIKPDNESYNNTFTSTKLGYKVFQADSRFVKVIKNAL